MRLTVVGGLVLLVVALAAFASGAENPTMQISTPPSGLNTLGSWPVTIDISRQGRPLSFLRPLLTIQAGATKRSFVARPSGPDGRYRVQVTFPRQGDWSYGVWLGRHYARGGVVHVRSGRITGRVARSGGL
ncbi:MAG: hypothetical protein QOK13_2170 [Gaiellaceae bacterium]|nr:hypothetical protein [Gaiellaceae bacterium]MDX6508315.1 hypothetical protein [Gaiellaceae bacterium]